MQDFPESTVAISGERKKNIIPFFNKTFSLLPVDERVQLFAVCLPEFVLDVPQTGVGAARHQADQGHVTGFML